MTRTILRSPRTLLRRGLATATVLVTVGLATVHDGADASVRTQSEAIAAEAERALAALERWSSGHNPADYVRFVQSREATAAMTAADLQIDAGALRSVWAGVSIEKQHAVLAAMSQLGVPYRSIHSEEGVGFDCSGLTIWAFAEAGLDIPRVSRDQIRAAEPIDAADAEPGDLVYYPGHISMYLGVGTMVHSPYSGSYVEAIALPDRSLDYGDAFAGD